MAAVTDLRSVVDHHFDKGAKVLESAIEFELSKHALAAYEAEHA